MFRDLSLSLLGLAATQAEQIELSLSNGFRGIEIDLVEFHSRAQTGGLPHARRLLDSAKLRVSAFRLPFDPASDDATFAAGKKQLGELAELAAALGCTRALAAIAPASDERPYHANFEFYRQRLNEVATLLAPHNIRLGVGFSADPELRAGRSFEFVHSLDAALLLLGTIAARNVGIVLDLWDIWRSGGQLADAARLSAQQIVQVRLADAPSDIPREEQTAAHRLPPGTTGTIDSVAALVRLAELGYDGPITPAPDRRAFGATGRDGIVRQVGQALDKVWKAAGLTPAGKLAPAVRK